MINKVVAAMFALGLLLILSSVATLAVTGGQTAAAQVKIATPAVETNPVTVMQLAQPVAPAKKVNLAFTTGGTLAELLVAQGDTVERGQLLATLDAKMAMAQLDKAKAALARAEAEAKLAQFPIANTDANPDVVIARENLVAAQRNVDIIATDWNLQLAEAEARRKEASSEYERVFQKYLGLDVSTNQSRLGPQELLAEVGIDLDAMFDSSLRPAASGQLVFSTPGVGVPLAPVDDMTTPWDESLVYGWLNYYEGDILTSFDALTVPEGAVSIAVELTNAWRPLGEAWDAYDAVELGKAKDMIAAEYQLATAKQAVQSLQDFAIEPDSKALDLAMAELAAAEADVALAELLVANMEIRAPFAGTVAPIGSAVVPGGWMTAGSSVIGLQAEAN